MLYSNKLTKHIENRDDLMLDITDPNLKAFTEAIISGNDDHLDRCESEDLKCVARAIISGNDDHLDRCESDDLKCVARAIINKSDEFLTRCKSKNLRSAAINIYKNTNNTATAKHLPNSREHNVQSKSQSDNSFWNSDGIFISSYKVTSKLTQEEYRISEITDFEAINRPKIIAYLFGLIPSIILVPLSILGIVNLLYGLMLFIGTILMSFTFSTFLHDDLIWLQITIPTVIMTIISLNIWNKLPRTYYVEIQLNRARKVKIFISTNEMKVMLIRKAIAEAMLSTGRTKLYPTLS